MTSLSTRLTRLLDRGFYPAELPPPFRTRGFSNVKGSFAPSHKYVGSTTFFDGATFRGPLRTFGVINPVSYFMLSRYIAENWSKMVATYKLSASSGARPKFPSVATDGRAIETSSLSSKRKSQQHLASVYPVILSLDINRFYGSIYTHSIPWAVLGKEEAKKRFHAGTLGAHWSSRLDTLARNCNQQQTIGIAIGPDTSRLISELILSRIDWELTPPTSAVSPSQVYHNIDDYQIGCFGVSEAENAQSLFSRAIARYELRLNDFKTSLQHGISFAPSNFQRHFDFLSKTNGRNFVEHFFEVLYAQVNAHPNTNVIGYALKRFAPKLALKKNRHLVQEYLQRLIYAMPHQARWILPILLGIYQAGGVTSDVRRLVAWAIETCVRRNDVGSLLWYLYSAIFLNISLSSDICNKCTGMSSELVDLMLMHGRHLGLFPIKIKEIRSRYSASGFDTSAWLPLYEVERRSWDTSLTFKKIGSGNDKDNLYSFLRTNNVEFYQTDAAFLTVSAFEGWNLTEETFESNYLQTDEPFDWAGFPSAADDWENYE